MKTVGIIVVATVLVSCADSAQSPYGQFTINDLMTAIITPATNTLWGVEDPQTDAEWKVLEDAALVVIDAGKQVQKGGAGPNDEQWAREPDWQDFALELTDAAESGLRAIQDRDLEALFEANDVLYPPCEGCHLKFHPGVAGEGHQS